MLKRKKNFKSKKGASGLLYTVVGWWGRSEDLQLCVFAETVILVSPKGVRKPDTCISWRGAFQAEGKPMQRP